MVIVPPPISFMPSGQPARGAGGAEAMAAAEAAEAAGDGDAEAMAAAEGAEAAGDGDAGVRAEALGGGPASAALRSPFEQASTPKAARSAAPEGVEQRVIAWCCGASRRAMRARLAREAERYKPARRRFVGSVTTVRQRHAVR
jgi:hypothetical protein